MSEDTETMLAILASMLPEPVPRQQALLDALVQSKGDIAAAAKLLSNPSPPQPQERAGKRKTASLDSWVQSNHAKRTRSASPAKRNPRPRLANKPASSSSNATATMNMGSPSPSKRVVNLMDVLRPPPPSKSSVPRLAPLTLSNPSMVAENTPCTLHASVLPPELACELFYTMLGEARDWQRNKWWLFDRMVESPHRTSFYARHAADVAEKEGDWRQVSRFWYNGQQMDPPAAFPVPMEKACTIVEALVNAEMRKRKRFPLEWGGVPPTTGDKNVIWQANFAASNCYEGSKETVGFHSDRLTNLGPYPTIASLSLGTSRIFRLREVIPLDEAEKRAARTFNIPLSHNTLVIMHASCQERFKHSVPPQSSLDRFHPPYPPPPSLPSIVFDPENCRINITFRFYRPDFHPDTIPRCKCGVPTTLRPDMKKRQKQEGAGEGKGAGKGDGEYRYWWTCAAGDQNEGKGCGFWKVMDVKAEGRGPFARDAQLEQPNQRT